MNIDIFGFYHFSLGGVVVVTMTVYNNHNDFPNKVHSTCTFQLQRCTSLYIVKILTVGSFHRLFFATYSWQCRKYSTIETFNKRIWHTSSKRAFGRTFDIDDASVCVAHRQRTLSPSVSIIGNCILRGHPNWTLHKINIKQEI